MILIKNKFEEIELLKNEVSKVIINVTKDDQSFHEEA